MYLTIHPISRLFELESAPTGWTADAAAVAAGNGSPAATWVCAHVGASAGCVVSLWDDVAAADAAAARSGQTPTGAVVGPARRHDVAGLSVISDAVPGVIQVTSFDGPRDAAQVAADDLSAQRILPAVSDLPGLAGAIQGRADDGAFVAITFTDTAETMQRFVERIMSTELLPGEDPALLTGPDAVDVHRIVHATAPLRAVGARIPTSH